MPAKQPTSSATDAPFSLVENEHQVLQFWQRCNAFQQSLYQRKGAPAYVFFDGPPFATGLPHHGHLLQSTIKDIIPRYYTMRGYFVERRFGWDCHGLPIEHEINKSMNMSAQQAVEELGVAGFNDACRGIVQRYTSQWEKTVTRIGRWVDFEQGYKTMDLSYMESVWWVFAQLWQQDLVYHGEKVMPFSTALGTGLSNFEASSNYQDVQDPAITVLCPLLDGSAYLAIWTTTPWTLPANLAICVSAKVDYVKAYDAKRQINIIFAEQRLAHYAEKHDLTIKETFKGSTLQGQAYHPPFKDFLQWRERGAFVVLTDDYVTTEDGTGLVHCAPAFGEDDHRVVAAAGITDVPCPIDSAGCFTHEVPQLQGQYIKDADKVIIAALKADESLYEQTVLVHSYPFCPRSDTPLIYKVVPGWFIRVTALKSRLLACNQQITWVPEYVRDGRFGRWLENVQDWAVSRDRVWGTPLPIWMNDQTGDYICVESCAQLKALSGTDISDLHREQVDVVTFSKDGEPGTYRRVGGVFDCWFESGAMPYAQQHYPFEHAKMPTQDFSANFIAEGLDQTRGWFYTLNVLSVALFDQPAFRHAIVSGIVMAEDGKKMSKRLKNYTSPDQLMEQSGADALRLYLISGGLVKAEAQRFADQGVSDMARRVLLPWYNAFNFLNTYAKVDGWRYSGKQASDNLADQWLLSRTQSLKAQVAQSMERYHLYTVVPALLDFLDDLTNIYVRINRKRFWGNGLSDDKCAAYAVLYTALYDFTLCMAPFAPFLSEHIYQQLSQLLDKKASEQSVHWCDYPESIPGLIQPQLEQAMAVMQQILLLGRHARNEAKIKIKVPLRCLTVVHRDANLLSQVKLLASYIRSELNVKEIIYDTDETRYIRFYALPNAPLLGKRLGKKFAQIKQQVQQLSSDQLLAFEESGSITLAGEYLQRDDLLIYREALLGGNALSNRLISIALDTALDDSLMDEGLAREIVSHIQKTRKTIGLNVEDRIEVSYTGGAKLKAVITQHAAYIKGETLAHVLQAQDSLPQPNFVCDIDGVELVLHVIKSDMR